MGCRGSRGGRAVAVIGQPLTLVLAGDLAGCTVTTHSLETVAGFRRAVCAGLNLERWTDDSLQFFLGDAELAGATLKAAGAADGAVVAVTGLTDAHAEARRRTWAMRALPHLFRAST